ncbi:MAG: electron transport complex subunit RsxC [Spirochaetes bacterium]|uniref:Ion-translocating oxidoreductase complex subunit C n=1 Tax=Candidatus Ornithospirochaeta stercoripullorum TaxID=2840899 RepID=A0A9D9E0Y9_9SPIO|nr:electron transport complex subunit RsxC [Candidatus Ornithospirochaeta stercoripullorum]
MKLATFRRGGVHPDDKKSLSKDKKLERLPLPDELVVSMSEHLGAPAVLTKKKGDTVTKGEVIGTASGYISADVHSPVDGVVTEIRKVRVQSGAVADAAVIKCNSEQSDPWKEKHDWNNLSSSELLDIVRASGIVGMGGATFPTAVKLTVPMGKSVDALVVNSVECEPYLTSDYRLMIERPEAILEGVMIASRIVSPKRIIIGIEANKMDAVSLLSEKAREKGLPVEVVPLRVKYPQGDEKQLLKALLGREVPSGKLPLDVGAVVCNAGTCNAIYEAVVFHKPLIERVITVSGESINEPKNLIAPIGTKFSDLIAYCGGEKEDVVSLVAGGPMMGFAIYDEDTPMVKGSGGLLVLPALIDDFSAPCVLCGKCVQHCPMGLQPNKMFRNIKYGNYQAAMDLGLMDCKECGCCAYTCPSHLPLVQGFKLGKKMGRKKK